MVQRLGALQVDGDGVARRTIRCAKGTGGYEVDVRFEEALGDEEIAPPASTPPTVRWLSVRADGLSDDGARGRAVYVSSRLRPAPAPAALATPPVPRRAGLDFSRVATEPGLIGTRQSCAVRAATEIVRRRGDDAESPSVVVVTMPVTCTHASGRSNAELAFTAETTSHALLVGAGAMAHGIVESSRRLRVTHVTPPDG